MRQKKFIDWESGILSTNDEAEMFQELLSTGELGELPAKYARRADELRANGTLEEDGDD